MAEQDFTTKEPKEDYPGALGCIKKQLETLGHLSDSLLYLGNEMTTDGEVTLRGEMLVDLGGKVEMAVDAIHYQLDPKFKEHREKEDA